MTNDDNMADKLKTFFRAVFSHLKKHLKGKVEPGEIHAAAKEVLASLGDEPRLGTWDDALPVTVEQAKRKGLLWKTVRVFAHVSVLKDPQIVTTMDDAEGNGEDAEGSDGAGADEDGGEASAADGVPVEDESTCVSLRDAAGNEMWSLEVLGPDLIDKLQQARCAGLPVEFLGMPIAVPACLGSKRPDAGRGAVRKDIVFHLLDVRPSSSALNMLGASRDERQAAEDQRAALEAQGKTPFLYLTDALIEKLGIAASGEFTLLRDLLEFTVLQSLAIGRITHASGHLNLLLVGPPGQGKKLVGVAASMLNPACSELSASKVSAAGLVGASHHGNAGWTSTPGLLPQGSPRCGFAARRPRVERRRGSAGRPRAAGGHRGRRRAKRRRRRGPARSPGRASHRREPDGAARCEGRPARGGPHPSPTPPSLPRGCHRRDS